MRSPRLAVAVLCLIALCLGVGLAVQRATAVSPVIATIPVGMLPSAIGIDEATGRALVLNALDTTVSVLDDRTGALLATRTVGSNGGAHPDQIAVDTRTHHAFVLTDDGQVSMLDTRSGALLAATRMSGTPSAIAVDEATERVFIADADAGTVTMLDARTGSPLRSVPVGAFPEALAVSPSAGVALAANQGDNTVSLLDARTGSPLRTIPVDDVPQAIAVSDRYRVAFVAGPHGFVSRINLVTGARHVLHLHVSHPAAPLTPLLAVDDTRGLLLIALGAWIGERDLQTGRPAGMLQMPSAITALAVDPRDGDTLITLRGRVDTFGHLLGNGSLLVIDRHGHHRATVGIGLDPTALALDLRARRVLVADANLNPDGSPVRLASRTTPFGEILSGLRRWLPGISSSPPAPSKAGSVSVLRLVAPS